jgi:hypothetical protein
MIYQIDMERKGVITLLLATIMVGGVIYASAGQRVFAHNFSGDESAAFLANVDALKIQLMLVGANYSGNHASATEHAGHAIEHLNADQVKEIAEKNQRLGRDLPAALEKLKTTVEGNGPRSDIVQQIKDLNDMLGDALSTRIDSGQISNSTVQALVFANLVNEVLESYQNAYGIGEEAANDHSGMNMTASNIVQGKSTMNMTGTIINTSEDSGTHDKIVNLSAYQSARWLTLKTSSMYYKLNTLAPANSSEPMAKLRAGLDELKSAVESQKSLDDMTLIIHGKVHQNLMDAFHLKMQEEAPSMNMLGNATAGK